MSKSSCVHLSCLFAAVFATTVFGDYSDGCLSVAGPGPECRVFGNRRVYIFRDTTASASVTLRKNLTLEESLVVGGGGAGGNTAGGGGGGGGVLHSDVPQTLASGGELAVTVGAGGTSPTPTAQNKYPTGNQGGTSSVSGAGLDIVAYGGGGGAGYNQSSPAATISGQIGSGGGTANGTNGKIGTEGTQWQQGMCGGKTTSQHVAGGGGGAGLAADYEFGGEGLAFALTGERVVYGSGGGGGTRADETRHGLGGTNAGEGSGAGAGGDGVDGTGAGGGGGSFAGNVAYAGGKGGSGIVVLVFSETAVETRFFVCPVEDQLLVGSAVEPAVTVTNAQGEVLAEETDYDVSYSGNTSLGPGVAIATGKAGSTYAGYSAIATFVVRSVGYEDENIATSDASVQKIVNGKHFVYVFTNGSEQAVLRTKRTITLVDRLLVGGGGGGGGQGGAGGGGGGYVASQELALFEEGDVCNLAVGGGGLSHTGVGFGFAGHQGGHSWLSLFGCRQFAYGGGGGGGNASGEGSPSSAVVEDEIGSSGGSYGTSDASIVEHQHWNPTQGHRGSSRYYHSVGNDSGGAGGGAGAVGTTVVGVGANGGEGVTNSITGAAVVYGSGGGGGAKTSLVIAGKGGTNAGCGEPSDTGNIPAAAPDGFGGGGGGGGSKGFGGSPSRNVTDGGNGGSGTVILSFLVGNAVAGHMEIQPIAEQPYLGRPACPAVTVKNLDGDTLLRGRDYTVSYRNNTGAGEGTVTVTGVDGTVYAGFDASATFQIYSPGYLDNWLCSNDATIRRLDRADGAAVYVLTNAASAVSVGVLRRLQIEQVLLVGGGGAGGGTIGGGGGGGGVVASNDVWMLNRGATLDVRVGAGGIAPTPTSAGAGRYPTGGQGGHSSLSGKGLSLVAYGGGGGSGFTNPLGTAEDGEIGSGGGATKGIAIGTEGAQWNQGNHGGTGNDNFGGGGGGAFGVGKNWANTGAGAGGEGVTNSITGVGEVYGSGGGGGTRATQTPAEALGGTNAGAGSKTGSGGFGVDGFGGGGGGGGCTKPAENMGGNGGCGTVIFVVRLKPSGLAIILK